VSAPDRSPLARLRLRLDGARARHGRTFWILHSIWALANGAVVVALAEEAGRFWALVLGALALTWGSTLFFCWRRSSGGSLRTGLVSYATRILYQETLFFLLPFYVRSSTLGSVNVAFTGALIGLAVLACLDLAFDRWLRASAAFAASFSFLVSFSALQLLLPLVVRVPYSRAAPLALALAFAGTLVLLGAARTLGWRRRALGLVPSAAVALLLLLAPRLVPPAPLRLGSLTLAPEVEAPGLTRAEARVVAPVPVPVELSVRWTRAGELLRESRPVHVTAHDAGFRVWDAALVPGRGVLRVELLTESGQLLGRRDYQPAGFAAR
jgi:hypothetical protein